MSVLKSNMVLRAGRKLRCILTVSLPQTGGAAAFIALTIAALPVVQSKTPRPSREETSAKVIEALIKALSDAAPAERLRAARALAQIGPRAKRSLEPLRERLLADDDEEVRSAAAEALVEMGNTAVPALVEALGSGDAKARWHAEQALFELGPIATGAVPAITRLLRHHDPDVRSAAIWSLNSIQDFAAVPALSRLLKTEPDFEVRLEVVSVFATLGERAFSAAPAVIEETKRELRAREYSMSGTADKALWEMGPKAIPAILHALDDPRCDHDMRFLMLAALDQIAQRHKDALAHAVPSLARVLEDGDKCLQLEAMGVLAKAGREATYAVPAARKAIRNMTGMDRVTAARYLYELDPGCKRPLKILLEGISDADRNVRAEAAYSIGRVGAGQKELVRALIQKANDPYRDVRRNVVNAFWDWESRNAADHFGALQMEVVRALIERAKDRDATVRQAAAAALGGAGAPGRSAVDVLKELAAGDTDGTVRKAAQDAARHLECFKGVTTLVEEMKKEALTGATSRYAAWYVLSEMGAEAIPPLCHVMDDAANDTRVRIAAVHALEAMARSGTKGCDAALPSLRRMLGSGKRALYDEDRILAAQCLCRIDPASRDGVAALITGMRTPQREVRLAAVNAVRELNLKSKAVIDRLTEGLRDREACVRAKAAEALGDVGRMVESATPALTVSVERLMQTLRDPDPIVREKAADALGNMGHVAERALPALRTVLDNDNVQAVRRMARAGIKCIYQARWTEAGR